VRNASQMLGHGEIDALQSPRMPRPCTRSRRGEDVFESYVEVERAYYRRDAIFPIMHTIAIKRRLRAKPWIAMSLYRVRTGAEKIPTRDSTRLLRCAPCCLDDAENRGGAPPILGHGLVAPTATSRTPRAGHVSALTTTSRGFRSVRLQGIQKHVRSPRRRKRSRSDARGVKRYFTLGAAPWCSR
jgi:hypothetical protein